MPVFNYTTISINGYGGKSVPNLFLRQNDPADTLAIIFPGLRYTCDMPLLYYPSRLFAHRAADVLQVNSDYTRADYQSASQSEQADWLRGDAQAALRAGKAQGNYKRLILVGKSIGTLALAYLVSTSPEEGTLTIWLTPLLRQPSLVSAALLFKGPALYVAGTGDPIYASGPMQRIQQATGAETLIVEGADHSMEIPGDPFQSLQIMERVLRGIEAFLEKQS
jgi:predicted esterase